jgi:hypothetical protein
MAKSKKSAEETETSVTETLQAKDAASRLLTESVGTYGQFHNGLEFKVDGTPVTFANVTYSGVQFTPKNTPSELITYSLYEEVTIEYPVKDKDAHA